MRIQCATCIREAEQMEVLQEMFEVQTEFNLFYLMYQDLARKYPCDDYFPAFHGGRTV